MKKFSISIISIMACLFLQAQDIAYIDSRYILENIPDFNTAQDELNSLSLEWQEEIDLLKDDAERMYRKYQAEKYILPEDTKQAREDQIIQQEKEIKKLTKMRFGPEGDLYKKQQKMIQPIQDLIYTAVQELADEGKYDIIFDKSSDLIMLFSAPELDKSEEILEKLGY